uniref:Uncharacterized protein n=1 Tax=Magallana gigas TaxID=29159 RepID=K1RNE1_MAGGI
MLRTELSLPPIYGATSILHKRLTTELATFGKSVSTLRRALIFKIETMLPLTGMVVTLVGFVGDGAPVKGLDGV